MSTSKKYALIVRGPQGEAKVHPLDSGLGKDATRLAAMAGARYELRDQASGFAPDTVRVMRKGKDLLVFFDGEAIPRLTIEDHYAESALAQSVLVGKSEAGHYYAYVPESAAAAEAIHALADRPTFHGMVLGGGILPAWISPPLEPVAAPAASFGGLLPLAGGLALLGLVAAASGKDSPSQSEDVGAKSNAEAGLAVTLLTDANNDGQISASELPSSVLTTTVRASFDKTKVRVGDALVFTVTNGGMALPAQTHTLTALDIDAGQVSLNFARPAELQTQRVEVNFVHRTAGAATDAMPSDTALRLYLGPKSNAEAGLAVTLLTDANNDGWLNLNEMGTAATTTARASFDKDKVRVGDQLVFSVSNGDTALPSQRHTLTDQNLTDGRVDLVLNGLLEGQNQRVQVNFVNQTEGPATDTQALDTARLDITPIGFLLGSSSIDGNGLVSLLTFNPSTLEAGAYRLTVGSSVFQGALTGQALPGDASHQIRQNFLTAQTTAQGRDVYLTLWDAAGNASTSKAFASIFDENPFTFDSTTFIVI